MKEPKTIKIDDVEYVRKDSLPVIEPVLEDYVIVRTRSAGVFAGNLVSRAGTEGEMTNARRLWYWDGAASLSQLAMEGVSKPENCKFPTPVTKLVLTEIIEVISCTKTARESIAAVKVWKK